MRIISCSSILWAVLPGLLLSASKVTVLASMFVCDSDFDCQPNGTCGNEQQCVCVQGFAGDQCDLPCPLECENGGKCVVEDLHGGVAQENEYYCDCTPGYRGGLCQNPVPFTCDSDIDCQPNGSCDVDTCVCNPGYWGSRCEEPCPVKCQNGGQCVVIDDHGGLVQENEFFCDCPDKFTGGLCQSQKRGGAIGSSSSLSSGAKAGIAVGVIVGVSVLVAGLMLAFRRGYRMRLQCQDAEIEKAGVDIDATSGEPVSTTDLA